MDLPSIAIVTVCLNQAETVEDAIGSVLDQDYPRLQYAVMDGGSRDGTIERVAPFADRLAAWVAEADRGQAT